MVEKFEPVHPGEILIVLSNLQESPSSEGIFEYRAIRKGGA
jgi:hypothetical protein